MRSKEVDPHISTILVRQFDADTQQTQYVGERDRLEDGSIAAVQKLIDLDGSRLDRRSFETNGSEADQDQQERAVPMLGVGSRGRS